MTGLMKTETKPREVVDRFDRIFEDWMQGPLGSFMRTLPLPDGVSESDVTAGYKDGILEIKVPAPAPVPAPTPKATKVAITKG